MSVKEPSDRKQLNPSSQIFSSEEVAVMWCQDTFKMCWCDVVPVHSRFTGRQKRWAETFIYINCMMESEEKDFSQRPVPGEFLLFIAYCQAHFTTHCACVCMCVWGIDPNFIPSCCLSPSLFVCMCVSVHVLEILKSSWHSPTRV